ncbi:MAG: tetratricopeptide repeat protein [Paludibacteraceae bacterium]|nr:tetratricopeptide repeat protein [Paludibacteraceae bacterium]
MKKSFLFLSLMAAILLTSCGAPVQPEQISVNPNPLTVVGNKVNAHITGTFPRKKFAKNAVLTVTPVLKYNGKEVPGEPVTYIGEKIKENGKIVSYRNGGTYTQNASFDFVPEMAQSELYLRFEARQGKKVVEIPDVKIADGVITTAKLVDPQEVRAQSTPDKFQRIIQETQEADILFLIQQANLRDSQLNSKEMKALKDAITAAAKAENKAINNLEVLAYASPDGGLDLNTSLANNREKNAQRYMERILRRSRVKDTKITSDVTPEDWEGFKEAVEKSNVEDKEMVLRVLSMYSDPEEREAQIKNLAAVYKTLATDVLPALRRSRIVLTTDIIGKSDEEIANLAANDPSKLNVEELLYAATLAKTTDEKMAIYRKVADQYNDYRAYNNMGMIYYAQGNMDEARRNYAKALSLAPNNPDVNYNAGVMALADGDLKKAEERLGKAVGTQGDLKAAMGTLYTMKGDYAKAKKSYAGANTNNAATQMILNEDYAGARKALAAVETPNATTAYLSAIVGARTNDREAVYSNLKSAIAQNPALKQRARADIEFAKYAEDEQFLAIVK